MAQENPLDDGSANFVEVQLPGSGQPTRVSHAYVFMLKFINRLSRNGQGYRSKILQHEAEAAGNMLDTLLQQRCIKVIGQSSTHGEEFEVTDTGHLIMQHRP